MIIERPPEDGGTFSYHFHNRGGCYRPAGARGFATASAALIAGLAERITQLNLHAITPYLDVMEAMDTAGLVVALEQATDPAGPDRFAYTLPGGGGAGGVGTEGAAIEAAIKQLMGPDGRRARRTGAPLAIAA